MLPMEIIDLHKFAREESVSSPLSVALGNFDGVHVGHAALISRAVEYARAHGIKSAVWTFSNDASALPSKSGAKCITSTDEKLAIFRELGVDLAFLVPFDEVRDYSPQKFVREILIEKCGAVCAVCGFNFCFGKGGVGDSTELSRLMSPRDCIVVPAVYVGGSVASSTAVRTLIEEGDVEGASTLLGRPFSLEAPVTEGKHLGRTIGIPTINQNFKDGYVIPKTGVYACTVKIDGKDYRGVTNVGVRPTIKEDGHKINSETHIIGYEGELYGENVTIFFERRLRDEMKFESVDDLCAQVQRDIKAAVEYFSK